MFTFGVCQVGRMSFSAVYTIHDTPVHDAFMIVLFSLGTNSLISYAEECLTK